MHRPSFLFLVALLPSVLLATPARADDDGATALPHLRATRVSLAATPGFANLHRDVSSPGDRNAFVMGGELRVYPESPHGFVLAFNHAEGIFGPKVSLFDAGYSLCLYCSRHIGDVGGGVYFDLGPALGIVKDAPPGPDHSVLGARVSLGADAYLGFFTLGVVAGYRGGVPLGGPPDGWEGAASLLARVGFVFDEEDDVDRAR
jgi:hypothetical protein